MNADELNALTVDVPVDARGTACPGPLLEAKRNIGEVPAGGVMEVMSSDDGTIQDVSRWCRKMGHEYLGDVAEAGYWRVFLRKAT